VEEQQISTIDIALISSPTRWCDNHKGTLSSWNDVKLSIQYCFLPPLQVCHVSDDKKMKNRPLILETYDCSSDSVAQIDYCLKVWEGEQLPSQF